MQYTALSRHRPTIDGLRDYGVEGQIGIEETLTEYLERLTVVFREARRVLRPDGVMWLNMGDGYAGGGNYRGDSALSEKQKSNGGAIGQVGAMKIPHRLKPKDLIGQPWRLAFALQDDGWWLRSDCIWHKPNPMPESVTDRPTKSHEYVFLMTKSARYWYDAFSVREPNQDTTGRGNYGGVNNNKPHYKQYKPDDDLAKSNAWLETRDNTSGRNKRTVWTVATHSFPEAHYATFPPKLIEPMILAGCPPKVCCECGAPHERVVEQSPSDWANRVDNGAIGGSKEQGHNTTHGKGTNHTLGGRVTHFTGWRPTCKHTDAATEPGIVLDMFMGSGTVALVATQHGRRWIGSELSAEYVAMANKRLSKPIQVDMFTSAGE